MQPPPFPPDDLSRRSPALGPVTSERRTVIETVAAHFLGGEALREVQQVVSLVSLNANYLLEMASGRYVLKLRGGPEAARAIAREHALLSLLAARGVRVPAVIGAPRVDETGAWMLTAHVPGEHFVGGGRQIELVAAELAALVRALGGVELGDAPAAPGDFLDELPALRREVEHGPASPLRTLLVEHGPALDAAFAAAVTARAAIERARGLVHVDLHPMNVLLDDARACLLDMEDVIVYPFAAALGFAGYKLVRRAVVEPAIGVAQGPALAQRWAAALAAGAAALGIGARYRELALVAYILREHTQRGSFADGVEAIKHLRAFAELDWLFPRDPS